MIRRSLNVLVPTLAAAALATLTLTAQETGIKNKRPVFAGACKVCPWGRLEKSSKARSKTTATTSSSAPATSLGPSDCAQDEQSEYFVLGAKRSVLGARCSAEIHARCATQRTVHPAWAPHPA
jgi:hypothetical protein